MGPLSCVLLRMSKIYIIGGAGFIGQHLRRALFKEFNRDSVVVVDRLGGLPAVESYESNSIVVYLSSVSQHRHTTESAVSDLANLDKAFIMAKQSRSTLFVASTSAVSGGNTAHACYAKWAEILAAHYKGSVRTHFLRFYSVYGEGQHENLVRKAIQSAIFGTELTVWGSHYIRDWIHVSDAVDYLIQVLNNCMDRRSLPSVLHVGTGRGLPVSVALEIIENMVDRNIHRVVGPNPANEPVVSVAQKILMGWSHKVTFEQGILQTYNSYLHNGQQGKPEGTEETGG